MKSLKVLGVKKSMTDLILLLFLFGFICHEVVKKKKSHNKIKKTEKSMLKDMKEKINN